MPPKGWRKPRPVEEEPEEVDAMPEEIKEPGQASEPVEPTSHANADDAPAEIDDEALAAALEEEEKHYRLFAEDYFDSWFAFVCSC